MAHSLSSAYKQACDKKDSIPLHLGVASGKCGFTTLRKPKYKKSNFSVL